jgi:hypothetical protein
MSAIIANSAETSRPANGGRVAMPRSVVNFWRWWAAELRGVFRPLLHKYWVDRADTVDIRLTTDAEAPLPTRLAGRDVRVVVDTAHVLQKSVAYPAAVEENLAAVIINDLDRQTPFTADQIYLAHRVERRYEAADGMPKIDVELTIVLRRVVAPLLERVRAAGASVYSVVIPGAAASSCGAPFASPEPLAESELVIAHAPRLAGCCRDDRADSPAPRGRGGADDDGRKGPQRGGGHTQD